MKTHLALTALALAGCASAPAFEAPQSLAAAETAFAAHSVRDGMRAAFLAAFADDGVFVRSGWTPAKAHLAPRPNPPIRLDWRPQYVEVAASGELGLSTGPWKLTQPTNPDVPATFGQFVSIWKRKAGGAWQVAVDLGIGHPEPTLWDRPLETLTVEGARSVAAPGGIEAAEEAFERESRSAGVRSALAIHGSHRLRVYRGGFSPALGKAEALALSAVTDERIAWTVERAEAAQAGDLGYARGRYASASAPAVPIGHYLRVWRLEGGAWRIALDVVNPLSAK